LSNGVIAQSCRGVVCDSALQKIVRGGTGIVMPRAHSAPRREIQ